MRRFCLFFFFFFWFVVLALAPATAQVPATIGDQLTSEEHLAKPGWWPRKGDAPRNDYVGAKVCAGCHSALASGQSRHAMAHTSMPAAQAEALAQPADFKQGPFDYRITRENNAVIYTVATVAGNGQSFSVPLLWAFGSGNRGQSYLFRNKGKLYEARISFFRNFGFNVTPDHPDSIPDSLDKALGREISANEAPLCFGCHTTAANVSNHFDGDHFMPGISCEECHGPGAGHVAEATAGSGGSPGMTFNPGRLSPVASVDFCGSCHRTWWDINQLGYHGINNARFPVYRLESSKCWGKGDSRITCIACHDPHKPLVKEASAYDEKCLSCHVGSARMKATADHPGNGCPVSKVNCVSCHMPKYEIPKMRSTFTDHRIRVVKDVSLFPDE